MTPAQAGDLVKRLLAAYPTQRQRMTPTDIGAMTVVYTAGLVDLDYELARAAVDRADFIGAVAIAIAVPPATTHILALRKDAARDDIN